MAPIDPKALPVHVGIIMDGNGRWAASRGKPRTYGHREGLKAAKRVVRAASELGLRYLSLYTFSTENWKRARDEVNFLMLLIRTHLRKEFDFYREHRIRVIHSGDPAPLPPAVLREIERVSAATDSYTGLTVNLAINYGGRDEIVRAFNRWLASHPHGAAAAGGAAAAAAEASQGAHNGSPVLSLEELERHLDQPELPAPDLIIRTAGEQRLSNFLLWESAYAELFFSPLRWPDWDGQQLEAAIVDYQQRRRTFGGRR
jgi:undecaprenyl diphosphate synthase